MATKVYKEWKLSRDGENKFNREHKTLRKKHVVIDERLAEIYNDNTVDSGLFYELDIEATKELNLDINRRTVEKRQANNKTTFSKKEPKPDIIIDNTEEDKQKTYNERKQKLIEAGYVFDVDNFTKGNKVVSSAKVADMIPMVFGKLIKQK
jgi:hypothetical protein